MTNKNFLTQEILFFCYENKNQQEMLEITFIVVLFAESAFVCGWLLGGDGNLFPITKGHCRR